MIRRAMTMTPKSRPARRLRRIMLVVIFSSIMSHKLRELRWGQYVEHGEHILLDAVRKDLPGSYLDALVSCPLPPGWIASVLPVQVRQQILTYAKNKLATLVGPIAKRRVHRSHVIALRDQLVVDVQRVNEALIRKLSPMFDCWSSAAIDELLKFGRLTAYRQGMWVSLPTKHAYSDTDGMVLLHGTVCEFTLKAEDHPEKLQKELNAPMILAETRHVLAMPSKIGYVAKTPVLIFELPFRDIHRIGETLVGHAREKYKRFIANGRSQQITSSFHLKAEDLQTMHFFSDFNEADLHLISQTAKPRVAFEKDVIIAAGQLVPEIVIICRGTANLMAGGDVDLDAMHRIVTPDLKAAGGLPQSQGKEGQIVLTMNRFGVFGADYLTFEDRSPFSLVASTIVEYWVVPAASLHGVMKNTIQRKAVIEAASHLREQMMTLQKDSRVLKKSAMRDVPHLRRILDSTDAESVRITDQLVDLMHPTVFKAGDRVVSAGEDMNALVVVLTGRVHKLVVNVDGDPTDEKKTVPCVLGDNFLMKARWACSWTASRVCESWILSRVDAWRVIRSESTVASIVRTALNSASDVGVSPGANHSSPHHGRVSMVNAIANVRSEVTSIDEQANQSHTMACAKRAEHRANVKAEHDFKEHREEEDRQREILRRRKKLAPNISNKVPFVAYEGLHPVRPSAKEAYQAVRKLQPQVQARSTSSVAPVHVENSPPVVVRRSSKAAPPRSEKLTVSDRLQEELEEEVSRIRRKIGSASISTPPQPPSLPRGDNSTMSHSRLSGSATVVAPRPRASRAEKNVLKQILAQHDAILSAKRLQADKATDVLQLAQANPYSSIEAHAPLFKLSPTGELYTQAPGSRNVVVFNPRSYQHHAATSYLSAHAFSEL